MIAPGCPFCGEPEADVDEISPGEFACVCNDCGAIGPKASWAEGAVILWNGRVARRIGPNSSDAIDDGFTDANRESTRVIARLYGWTLE